MPARFIQGFHFHTVPHTRLTGSILLALAAMSTSLPVHAADGPNVFELQNENARLRQELESLRKLLNANPSASPSAGTTAGAEKTVSSQTGSSADAELEKVVIRSERNPLVALRDVPTSISVVTGEELEQKGTLFLGDILKKIGNVNFNPGNARTGSLSLRGVTVATGDQIDPSVGVTVDGVSYAYNPLSTGSDFVDVDTVDVTRGPQGTLGGKNTSLGQINVTTRRPSFTPEANASITLGQRNTLRTQAAAGGAIVDDLLAYRITFSRDRQDGTYNNDFKDLYGRQSYNSTERSFGRIQLLLTPNADFSARLSVDYQPNGGEFINGTSFKKALPLVYSNSASTVNTANPAGEIKLTRRWFTQQSAYGPTDYLNSIVYLDNNGAIITGTKGASSELKWNLGSHILTSITAFKNHYFSAANDDGTPFNISSNGGYITRYKQYSQELRLNSTSGGLVDYQTGLYLFSSNNDSISRTRYGSDAGAWNASNAQYASLDADAAGRSLLENALNRVYKVSAGEFDNKTTSAYGEANWHWSEPLTLTTGLRFNRENRKSTQSNLVTDNGFGSTLNPVVSDDVQLGGFASNATTGALTGGANSTAQLNQADAVANQYYGVPITGAPGTAYSSLSAAQKAQVADAKALRATVVSGLYNPAAATPYKGTLANSNLSLSYKLNPGTSTYVTWQHGAKAGIAQINGATALGGKDTPVLPEKSNSFEIGVKSALLDNSLVVNADVFVDHIKNFQQTVYYFDPIATAIANDGTLKYSSGTGNVAKVQVKGVEVDATYSGVKNTSIRFAGAYNDARYKDYQFAGQPSENGYPGAPTFRDVSGRTLPNAPKFTFNLSADYSVPIYGNKIFHAGINYRYISRYNSDTALSDYGWVKSYGVTDLSIGLGRSDKLFDVNLLVNNLFSINNRNDGWSAYTLTPGTPRWIGVVVSSKL